MAACWRRAAVIVLGLLLALPAAATAAEVSLSLVIQLGHSTRVTAVAVSPDGKYLVTGSEDATARLWELKTGRELRTFSGHLSSVNAVAISPDGSRLVTGSSDATAKLWDLKTGAEIRSFSGHTSFIEAVAVSPDGKYLVTGSADATARLWDLATGRELRTFSGHRGTVTAVAIAPGGSCLLTGGADATAKLWDLNTGRILRTFFGHLSAVTAVAISPDSSWVATGSADATARLWDFGAGAARRTLFNHGSTVRAVAISPDGSQLLTGSDLPVARLWDPATGAELRAFSGHAGAVAAVAITPDGKGVITGSADATAKLWNPATGAELLTFTGFGEKFQSSSLFLSLLAVTPDGSRLLTGNRNANISMWDLRSGAELRNFSDSASPISALVITPDGNGLVTGDLDGAARLRELNTGAELRSFSGAAGPLTALAITPDGGGLVAGSDYGTVKVWDLATGEELRSFTAHVGSIRALAVTPDGRQLVTGSRDSIAKLWDLNTGAVIRAFSGHTGGILAVAVTPDGRQLVTGSRDGAAKLWDLNTGEELRTFAGHGDNVSSVAVTPDGRYLVTGSGDDTARLWDLATGAGLKTFSDPTGSIRTVAVTPDGSCLATRSSEGVTKLWNLASGNELISLISLSGDDWAIFTPAGYFDCSEQARDHVHFARGFKIFDLDLFADEFHRPGLFAQVMSGVWETIVAARGSRNMAEVAANRAAPAVEIIGSPAGSEVDSGTITVRVRVTDQGGGIGEVQLFHNAKRVAGGGELTVRGDTYSEQVFEVELVGFPERRNRIMVRAANRDRTMTAETELTLDYTGPARPPRVHIVAIGINDYENDRYDLNFARADADSFATLFRAGSARLFERSFSHNLYNREATAANILAAFDELAAVARPEDAVIIYYAGHGRMLDDAFYFITTEVTRMYGNEGELKESGLSDSVLVGQLSRIPARKVVIFIDACESGGFASADGTIATLMSMRGAAEEKAMAQLSRSAGVWVMASTTRSQQAGELARLGHGIFSYLFLKALGGQAEMPPADGVITVSEVRTFLDNQLPDFAFRFRRHRQYPYTFSRGQDFPLVLHDQAPGP